VTVQTLFERLSQVMKPGVSCLISKYMAILHVEVTTNAESCEVPADCL